MKKANWISHGLTVWFTLVFAFCLSSIVDSRFHRQITESDIRAAERGIPTSLSPRNLEGAPELFRLGLAVESLSSPVEDMRKTKAWDRLQNTTSEYAQLLKFVEGQNRLMQEQDSKRSLWTNYLSLISSVAVLVFAILYRRNDRDGVKGEMEIGKTGTYPM